VREVALVTLVMDLTEHLVNDAPIGEVCPVAATVVARTLQLAGDRLVGADAVLGSVQIAMDRFYALRRLRDAALREKERNEH
jgi:hypothetical protein